MENIKLKCMEKYFSLMFTTTADILESLAFDTL